MYDARESELDPRLAGSVNCLNSRGAPDILNEGVTFLLASYWMRAACKSVAKWQHSAGRGIVALVRGSWSRIFALPLKSFLQVSFAMVVIAALALIIARLGPAPDALYQGKPAAEWALELNSPLAATRAKAAEVIRTLGPDAAPPLIKLLRTPDPALAAPLRAIGNHLPARMSRRMLAAVRPSEARQKRASAAQALSLMGAKAQGAVPMLTRALADDQTVAFQAALALAHMGEPGVKALTESISSGARMPCASLGYACSALGTTDTIPSNAIPALITVMQTGCEDAANRAATSLGAMYRVAVPQLIDALAHPDLHARSRAINALAAVRLGATDAIPRLIQIAATDETLARVAAVNALGQIRPTSPEVVTALTKALGDSSMDVRLRAVQGLSRSPRTSRRAVDALVNALKDTSAELRANAASLLGEIGGPSETVVPALLATLQDENDIVRTMARAALARLGVPPVQPASE